MKIIYTELDVECPDGFTIIDPKDFTGPIKEATIIFYDGENLNITYGYETRGIEVLPLSKLPKKSKGN